ncbi:MAG: hypothetical protein KC462_04525 [Cyanobacteria bacterium HKST-UBA05]|nr:hypothetical protein [Cyanobacteria bacterium HKST-UBA05]
MSSVGQYAPSYNFYGNQNAQLVNPASLAQGPYAVGSTSFNGPGSNFFARGVGQFTAEYGQSGLSLSIPVLDPSVINAATIGNNLGLGTPFATRQEVTDRIPPGSFGLTNPYSPLSGSVLDPNALGGILGNPLNNFFGGNQPGGIFGTPGGSLGNPGAYSGGGYGGGYGAPAGYGGASGGYGAPAGYGGGGGYGAPSGYGGGGGYGQPNYGGFPNFFSNPALFGPVPPRVLDGSGQVFTQNAGPFANQFTNLTNGVNAGLFQGNSQTDPSLRGVTSVLRNEFGNYYGYVGPSGGVASVGLGGVQVSGPESWGLVTSAINPAMIVNFDSAAYRNTNFNKGFANF